jgi:transcription antitermination factor NusG
MSLTSTEHHWYALQVRLGRENAVARLLQTKAYRVFLPTYERKRYQNEKATAQRSPLFPGYLFCNLALSNRTVPVLTTPGVQRIVGLGCTPSPVPESEIDAVRAICESGCPHGPHPYLAPQSTVRITRGPLAGIEGTLVRVQEHNRLVVSISLLQRSVAVQLSADWVTPSDVLAAARRSEWASA